MLLKLGKRRFWALAGALLVFVYMASAAVLGALYWDPGRGNSAVLVRRPHGLAAGAGDEWIIISTGSNKSILLTPGKTYNISGLSARIACKTEWGLAVAGTRGSMRVLSILSPEWRPRWEVSLKLSILPSSCSYRDGLLAVLFTDPVLSSRLLLYNGSGSVEVIRLNRQIVPAQPSSVSVLGHDTVLLGGKGFYTILRVGAHELESHIYKVSFNGTPVTIKGAVPTGNGTVLYGYAGSYNNYKGLVYVPGKGWLWIYGLSKSNWTSTKIHAAITPYPGVIRLLLEQVGREIDIVEIRGGAVQDSKSVLILVPYMLRHVKAYDNYLLITSDLFLGKGKEKTRTYLALIIRSLARMDIGVNETFVVAKIGGTPKVRAKHVELTVSGPAIVEISASSIAKSIPLSQPSISMSAGSGEALWMGAYIDRALLLCGSLAAAIAFASPVAWAVLQYNSERCEDHGSAGKEEDRRA